MKALVINLPRETTRLSFQRAQAGRLGLQIEVIPAVSVVELAEVAKDTCWTRWQRPLRDVEKATLLSHREAWRRVIALNQPTLVLEDDAWLMETAKKFMVQAAQLTNVEHLSLETRGRRKLLGASHPEMPALRRLWLDRTGAAAYILWPEGARKLLARSKRVPALADAVPVETRGLLRWQAAPAQAIQIDMAAHYRMDPPIAVESAISTIARPLRGGLRYRIRRTFRQVMMGLASLRPGTTRIELRPDTTQLGVAHAGNLGQL